MSKVSPLINSFSSGEFGPLASARVDLDRYKSSMQTCLNYVPSLQGGLMRRPGTKYVATTKSNGAARLEKFVFSNDQTYILEFGNLYVRFYTANAQLTNGGTPVELVTPYTTAQLFEITFCQSNDFLYIFHKDVAPRKITRYSSTSWGIGEVLTSFASMLGWGFDNASGNLSTVCQATPSATTGSVNLTVTSSSSLAFTTNAVAHTNGEIKLTVAAGNIVPNGMRVLVAGVTGTVEANGTWEVEVPNPTTIILKGSTFVNAYTTPPGTGTFVYAPFKSTDVGRRVRVYDYSNTPDQGWVTLLITAFTSSTVVVATIEDNSFFAAGAFNFSIYSMQFGLYGGGNGYPSSGCFHEDRLILFGPNQYIAGSRSGDYENFAGSDRNNTITSSHGFVFALNSNDSNNARWIVSDEKGVLAGTTANEWLIKSASTTEAISGTSISAKKVTSHGSKNVFPVQSGKAVLFIQYAGRKMREFNYFYDVDGFRCTDLTQLASHVLQTGSVQMALQKQPHSLVWTVRTDGLLACLTYDRDVEGLKVGWHRHQIGGTSNAAGLNAIVESIACIPSSSGDHDQIWMIVKRYIGASTVRYVEYMTKFFDAEIDQEDAFHVDSGLTYDTPMTVTAITKASPAVVTIAAHGRSNGDKVRFDEIAGMTELNGNVYKIKNVAANTFELTTYDDVNIDSTAFTTYISGGECRKLVTTVSGLSHLNGQVVQAWGDGADLGDYTVAAGAITLDEAAAVVSVGLGFNSDGKLPRLEAGSRDGTSIGKTRRTHRVGFMLDRTIGMKIGDSFDDLRPMNFEDSNDQMNQGPALFTGIMSEEFTAGSDFENNICWRQDRPGPGTILAIMPQMVTQDR